MKARSQPSAPPFPLSPKAMLLREEPLAPLTSFGIGGPAEWLLLPAVVEDFREAVRFAASRMLPWRILGSGTNVLIPDEGLRGLTIKPWLRFSEITIEGTQLRAQAGATMWGASRDAAENALSGLEWACGIPGSVGGAVLMNAGVKEYEIKDVLAAAIVLRRDGFIEQRTPQDLALEYRSSALQQDGGVVLEATFSLQRGDESQIYNLMNDFLQKRRQTQPLNKPNCGSVFRNPPGDHAGRLIEAAGCKGLKRGGMQVSELHANFIVNTGGGSAKDVLALVEEIKRRVYDKSGVTLEMEMRILE
ncbi:MAG TPA: UDP-N-acetylmuramate dehydrogenase [Acidobacteriota bacterium]|nr:UDP-N-acetylmuramate dehydrogenase [Acidobacteriota bacterium]